MKFNLLNPDRSHEELSRKYNAIKGITDISNGDKLFSSLNEKAESVNQDTKEIVYVITSSAVDRYKEIVDPNGAEMEPYSKAKKTVFFNHNYSQVVGRSLWEKQKDEKWIASLAFADSTDFSKDIWNLAKDGYLGMTSIGFIPKSLEITALEEIKDLKVTNRSEYDPKTEVWVWRKWEMLEWSLVGVGANPDAYEISKLLTKNIVKSDEVKSYLRDEIIKLEIEKNITDLQDEIIKLKNNSSSSDEINSLKSEVTKLNKDINKLKRSAEIAGDYKLDYEAIVAGAISRVSGKVIK